jgi:predicted metal-dependent hydrolase
MQLEWFFGRKPRKQSAEDWLMAGSRRVRLCIVRNPRAEARRFAERQAGWLEKQLLRQAAAPLRETTWHVGSEILFRGQLVHLDAAGSAVIRFGSEELDVRDLAGDLRPEVERHLRHLAARELPPLVIEFAARHQLQVNRVTVRNQRSRWGSCSRRGQISLNWRLVQAPASVRDYIILHELAHLRQMNHSRRFWAEVARLCPDFEAAERWLKAHAGLLS